MNVDLSTCKVKKDKVECDLADKTIIAGRSEGRIDDFFLFALPYVGGSVGVGIPIFPGGPTIDLSGDLDFPFTIFPLPKKVIDRLGNAWLPVLFPQGKEDDYQTLPTPEELIDNTAKYYQEYEL
jgi:hypothetical protein